MALLEKLTICGIRSFSPQDIVCVDFSAPLTLFLGQNGCGKTTIIECIKYGLTGELPAGSDSGKRFVNDPKLLERSSTKANVKLRFTDCKGNHITIARSMEVQAKTAGGLTYKKLNHTVRWEDPDRQKKEDMSGRCADIDAYCAQKLNVSKPILNNVIFCHQENSNWPLEESKKLKEKFDEIFGAKEYNNCVNYMRKLIKSKKDRIDVLQEQCNSRKDLKMIVDKQKEKLNAKKEQLQVTIQKIEDKQTELEPMKKRMDEILELEQVLGTLQMELKGKEASLKGLDDQKNALEENIHNKFEGTDEELEGKINSFENDRLKTEKILNEIEKRKTEFDAKIAEGNREQQKLQEKIGQLKEEEHQHKKKIEERRAITETALLKLGVTDVEENEDANVILLKIKDKLQKIETSFEKLTSEKEQEEKELQKKIDEIRENCISTKQNAESKLKLKAELDKKTREVNIRLKQLENSISQLKIIENKIETLQTNLKKRKDEFNEHTKAQEIEELAAAVQTKEQKLEKLEREYRQLQQNYVTEQSIDREKLSVLEKEQEITSIKTKHIQNFEKLFGQNIPGRNYERSVKLLQDREEAKFVNLTKKIDSLQKEVTMLEATIKHASKSLKQYQEELETNKNKVDALCRGRPFQEVLKETHARKEKLQRDKGQYRSAQVMYEAFINEFEKQAPCCPICETDFSNKKNVATQLIRKLRGKIEEVPTKLNQVERDLRKEEELFNKLQQLKPVSDTIESLSEVKIPLLEADLAENTTKLEDVSMELAAVKNEIVEPKSFVETSRKVLTDASLLDKYISDIEKSNSIIGDLQTQLVNVPSNRARDEVESEIDELKMELSNDRKQQENKKKLLDQHKERLLSMNTNIQNEIQKKLETEKSLQEKPLLERQLSEMKAKIEELSAEIDMLRDVSVEYEDNLKEAERAKEATVKKNKTIREEERNKILTNKRLVDDIERLQRGIDQYIQSYSENKLKTAQEDLIILKSKMEKLENMKTELTTRVVSLQQNLAKQATNFRELTDNKKLRELEKNMQKLAEGISSLKTQIGNHNYKSVFAEKQRIQTRWDEHSREINVMLGEQKEIENFIKESEAELNKPKNKYAEREFLKKYYELRTEQIAKDDLDVYVRALEVCVLKFHKERMTHVNKSIRELWRDIYKGNDIDYIEIETDDSVGGSNKRRSYNYSVMQVRKGAKLEMRGQCSAGQRVLACLVIRMALAETFSAHCGILALDEPTTNLDSTNIHSLSVALAKIVEERERQKNFQLLVITHDEEFLQTLTRDLSVPHLWRVKRNPDGFSMVQKETLMNT